MKLIESIKENEGFRGFPYVDSRGNMTIGYGTKLPISKEEAHYILVMRLNQVKYELQLNKPFITRLPKYIQDVLYEMAYQLGVPKCLKFKKMWLAVEKWDWNTMIKEMINSEWYKQTPNRVNKLIERIKND